MVIALSIPIYNFLNTNPISPDHEAIESYLADQPVISDDILIEMLEKEDIEKLDANIDFESSVIEDVLSNSSNLEQYLTN